MTLFSYRNNLKTLPETFQINYISTPLQNGLWSCLYLHFFEEMYFYGSSEGWYRKENRILCEKIWTDFFKVPIDTVPYSGKDALEKIRQVFFEHFKWNEQYDFIEFCAENSPVTTQEFEKCINAILIREFAGYRFINYKFVEITDEEEILEIESALSVDNEVTEHLKTALKLLSDKVSPDYRNSIKESISAVETICKKIVGKPSVTLGEALNVIDKDGKILFHGAVKSAFSNLYGWTSVDGGIRHGMMDASNIEQEDARLMLISCSAFVNYLKVKADKAGIVIN
jgi:hypothetical protein